MLRKSIIGLGILIIALCINAAYADSAPITEQEAKEVEKFFNSYVDSANNYREDLITKYENDAEIERVVIKPDGTKESVIIPFERYVKELKMGRKTAKLVNYKNKYTNKKYEKISDGKFKVKTIRTPFKDKKGLRAEFIITKTPSGYKISSESMETNVQKFLKEKDD